MQLWQIIAICVVIAIAAVAAWWIYERNRTHRLRERFGSEYDRRVNAFGRRRAEADLSRSERRIQKLRARPLSASDRAKFREDWRLCQARFVDDPAGAVEDADAILVNIMRARGYAADDPYDRVTDITAAYPDHASNYRDANDIYVRHRRGEASTEDLRKAFVHFRTLFDDILGGRDEEFRRVA